VKVIWLAVGCCSACRRAAHARRRTRLEAQALEAWQPDPPAIEGRHGVDPDPVEPMRTRLVERDNVGMGLDDLQQKCLVAETRQAILLGI
jgi:hypothetical protein